MAFTLQQSPSNGIAAAATSSVLTVANPSLGQLVIASAIIYSTGTAPVLSITDNGSAGWTLINSVANPGSDLLYHYWWYKVANATDVSSLTSVTFSWTNGASILGGSCAVDEYHGFVGTPTLDVNIPHAAVNSTTNSFSTATLQAHATELALGLIGTKASPGATTGTNTYSPNGGTTTYTWTSTHSTAGGNSSTLIRTWAAPTATPATSSACVMTWTSSTIANGFGATFFDLVTGGTPPPGAGSGAGATPTVTVGPAPSAGTGTGVGVYGAPQANVGPPAATGSGAGHLTSSVVENVVPFAATATGVGVGPTVTTALPSSVATANGTGVGVKPSISVTISLAGASGTGAGVQPTISFVQSVTPPDAYDEPGAYDEHLAYDYDLFFPSVKPVKTWKFVLVATDGTQIAELTQAKGKQVTWPLGDIPSASFTIDGKLPQAALIQELATDLIVYDKAGVKRFRGRLGSSGDDISAAGHTSSFSAVSYEGIFATRRALRDSSVGGTATASFTNVDQGQIAATLINDSENQALNTPLVTPGTGLLTGVTRTIAFTPLSKIGDLINGQLANVDNGFDWEIDGDLKFNVYYPERGIVTPLVLEYGSTVLKVTRTMDTSNFGNVIVETGASSTTPVVVEVSAPTVNATGLFETVIGDTSVIDQATLTLKANLALAKSDTLVPTHVLTLLSSPNATYPDGWWSPEVLWLGDTALVVVKSGRVNDIAQERISQVQVAIGDDGGEVVTLTTGPVSQDQAQQLDAALNRITRLETT